jgi:hypothetical protein
LEQNVIHPSQRTRRAAIFFIAELVRRELEGGGGRGAGGEAAWYAA